MFKINVNLERHSYPIIIDNLPNISIQDIINANHFIAIIDKNISQDLQKRVKNCFQSSEYIEIILEQEGEINKSFAMLENLSEKILQHGITRNTTLVAVGGGVVGDLTGFLASILLRGINFIQIPTTLLAMVDSSVGGKTGINSKYGKNMIGSFYQPKLVLCDSNFLKTLGDREFLSGYAEVVKYALLGDSDFFQYLEKNRALLKDEDVLHYIIKQSCQIKARIVESDEREENIRALLNFGHTFAHGLEKIDVLSHNVMHGEAVAVGMCLAVRLSVFLGYSPEQEIGLVENHLQSLKMPIKIDDLFELAGCKDFSLDKDFFYRLLEIMSFDKKNSQNEFVNIATDKKSYRIRKFFTFILINKIGDSFIKKDVSLELLSKFVESLS